MGAQAAGPAFPASIMDAALHYLLLSTSLLLSLLLHLVGLSICSAASLPVFFLFSPGSP